MRPKILHFTFWVGCLKFRNIFLTFLQISITQHSSVKKGVWFWVPHLETLATKLFEYCRIWPVGLLSLSLGYLKLVTVLHRNQHPPRKWLKKISNFIHNRYAENCFELNFDFQFWKTLISVLTDRNCTPRIPSFSQFFF